VVDEMSFISYESGKVLLCVVCIFQRQSTDYNDGRLSHFNDHTVLGLCMRVAPLRVLLQPHMRDSIGV